MRDLDTQMQDLDDFVSRAKSHNAAHQERHVESVQSLNTTVEQSFGSISGHFKETFDRVQHLGEEMDAEAQRMEEALEPLEEDVCRPLAELREDVQNTELREYEPTGETPEKTDYTYPTDLPRTAPHEALLAALRESPTPKPSPAVLPDNDLTPVRSPSRPISTETPRSGGLREMDPNLGSASKAGSMLFDPAVASVLSPPAPTGGSGGDAAMPLPLLKPTASSRPTRSSRLSKRAVADGAENMPPPALRSSTRRKSPRLH